jgi:hypothetical protein
MTPLEATVRKGGLQLKQPLDLPDGTEVLIQLLNGAAGLGQITGMTEEEQGDDPDSIRRWIEEFDAIPPLLMTPEEEADLVAWRAKAKAFNLAAVRGQMEEGFQ